MVTVVRSLGFGCCRRTLSVLVLSTRWDGFTAVDLVGEFSLVSATGNMNLRVQVPGLRYFSIKIVLGLQRHTLWRFWVGLCEEGYAPVSPVTLLGVPKSVALSGTIIISIVLL